MAENARRRAWRGGLRRLKTVGAGKPKARIDTSWLLTDGSICVDGWLVAPTGEGGRIEACAEQAGRTGPWLPLLRKSRPDVADHVSGSGALNVDLGFVGRVAGPVDPSKASSIRLRGPWGSMRLPVEGLRHEAIPEDIFAGLQLDCSALSPATLAPIVGVIAASPPARPASASIAYRNLALPATASTGIVVPFYRAFDYLPNLLRALAPVGPEIELTVVCDDPGLADDLVVWTRSWNDAVYRVPMQVLVHDHNAGFAAACNTGWRATSSALVLLLNSDILVYDPVRDLARLADGVGGGVVATAPVLLFPDGTLQHAGMEMVDAPDFPGFVLPGHPGKHGPADLLPAGPFDVPMLTGAAVCVGRDDLEAVGGVPVVFGRGDFEDVLLSLALRDRGRLTVDPAVRWTHMEGASYRRAELGGIALTLAKSVVVGERTGGRR